MGLGILEDHHLSDVPGTVLLADEGHPSSETNLQHGNGSDTHTILSPQPSDNVNDPLNWPMWKKEVNIIILCLGAMLNAGTNGTLLNASYYAIASDLHTPLTSVVLVSGYNLLAAGCSGPFVCALSRQYGKRPVFLASTLLAIIGTAIGETKMGYKFLLAARIIQGFSTSAFESLVIASVGDTYFVHQRGLRVAVINFILNAASSLSSIIAGQVYQNLGYSWLFHLFQIFLVIQFVAMFLFCPETTFTRNTGVVEDVQVEADLDQGDKETSTHEEMCTYPNDDRPQMSHGGFAAKKTYIQELSVFNGARSGQGFFKSLVGLLLPLLNPAACYVILTSGILNSWYVGSAIILSGVFSGSPWYYSAAQVGYLGVGPFVGGMIGSTVVACFSDSSIKYMVRLDRGIYEPELRLIFMPVAGVASTVGMFLFGYTMSIGANAILCSFLQGLMMFGVVVGIFSTLSYALDAFKSQANEIFIMNMVFKARTQSNEILPHSRWLIIFRRTSCFMD
ncbi:hypothetical protein PENSTE_c052G05494 [Penicillium steckii]|uniref:Major facilitator superfamily (MFS) profile domain-containing protein n=1 Tax=Penicillium steckii TaxID=303698 RepID=A0A1V6SI70_9EURO|nr:hypothetical protein PENSTE_c052G05494 [Penicillium steckii]